MRYRDHLMRKASLKLAPYVRKHLDPDDVVQSTLRTFFRRHQEGKFDNFDFNREEQKDGLLRLLCTILIRKCQRVSRVGRREEEAPALLGDDGELFPNDILEGISKEPSPKEVAELEELVRVVSERLIHPRDRKILELRIAGYSIREICEHEEVKCSESMVFIALRRIKEQMRRYFETK